MKLRTIVLPVALLAVAFSCNAQNGPTQPSVALSWTQSVGSTNPIAKNCVYRGTATGVYAKPAMFCSAAPSTAYTDTTVVRGTQYFYAVTAQDNKGAESDYSSELAVTSPKINPPTGLASGLISLLVPEPAHAFSYTATTADGTLRATVK
jgi:fibronectin type 3 domain-containing protein